MAQEQLSVDRKQILYWLIVVANFVAFILILINFNFQLSPGHLIDYSMGYGGHVSGFRSYLFIIGQYVGMISFLLVAIFIMLLSIDKQSASTLKAFAYVLLSVILFRIIIKIFASDQLFFGRYYGELTGVRILDSVLRFLRSSLYHFVIALFVINYLLSKSILDNKYNGMQVIFLLICVICGIAFILEFITYFKSGFYFVNLVLHISLVLFFILSLYQFKLTGKHLKYNSKTIR